MAGAMHRFHGKEGTYVSIESLIDWIREHPLSDGRPIPLLIWGAMGIGKTQQIKNYCRERGLENITYQPAHDINGGDIVGQAYTDEETGRTRYALPAWLPTDQMKPGVLFIDEINRAPEEVLAGLMEPLGEGTIAQSGWKLPDGWNIIAAANPSELGYMVQEVDEAMVDRLLHYAPGWDGPAWGDWAMSKGLPSEVIDFAFRHPTSISTGEPQLPHELIDKLRATPRSLEYLSALFEPDMPAGLLRVITDGLLGRDAAAEFRADLEGGERPLTLEELMAHTVEDNQVKYNYDAQMVAWMESPLVGVDLLRATSERMVASLVGSRPESEDPSHCEKAQHLGRYLALLDGHLREDAFGSLARSAPQWSNVLHMSADKWAGYLAQRGELLETRPRRAGS